MSKFSFYSTALAVGLTASSAFAGTSEACKKAMELSFDRGDVEINLTTHVRPFRLDHTKTRAELKRISGRSGRVLGSRINGLTTSELKFGLKAAFSMFELSSGVSCIQPSSINIEVYYDSHDVYVAQEFPVGSCQYSVTLEHEKEHVRINNEMLRASSRGLDRYLKEHLHGSFPQRVYSQTQGMNDALEEMSNVISKYTKEQSASVEVQHALLDSPRSYSEYASRCSRW